VIVADPRIGRLRLHEHRVVFHVRFKVRFQIFDRRRNLYSRAYQTVPQKGHLEEEEIETCIEIWIFLLSIFGEIIQKRKVSTRNSDHNFDEDPNIGMPLLSTERAQVGEGQGDWCSPHVVGRRECVCVTEVVEVQDESEWVRARVPNYWGNQVAADRLSRTLVLANRSLFCPPSCAPWTGVPEPKQSAAFQGVTCSDMRNRHRALRYSRARYQ